VELIGGEQFSAPGRRLDIGGAGSPTGLLTNTVVRVARGR
jgi:hypothetical protein